MSMGNEPKPRADGTAGMKRQFTTKQIIAAVIVVVALIAVLQNTRTAHFSFLFFDFEAPIWLWLVAIFSAGVATGLLLARNRARKKAAEM
jgi:uncharacterized integral membrane protein